MLTFKNVEKRGLFGIIFSFVHLIYVLCNFRYLRDQHFYLTSVVSGIPAVTARGYSVEPFY